MKLYELIIIQERLQLEDDSDYVQEREYIDTITSKVYKTEVDRDTAYENFIHPYIEEKKTNTNIRTYQAENCFKITVLKKWVPNQESDILGTIYRVFKKETELE